MQDFTTYTDADLEYQARCAFEHGDDHQARKFEAELQRRHEQDDEDAWADHHSGHGVHVEGALI